MFYDIKQRLVNFAEHQTPNNGQQTCAFSLLFMVRGLGLG